MARVLIVDDEKSIRHTLSEFLRREGHEVQTAEDADAAGALLQAHAFDVVVTDIILPRVSGVTLLQEIKKRAPDIQVIMMTGEPTVDTAVEAVRAGAYDYLAKPTGKRQLLVAVSQAARVKTLLDEKHQLEADNRLYREGLERMVGERTEALTARTRQFEAVRAVSVELARELDLTILLRLIVEQVTRLVGTTLGTCFLWDEAEQHLRPGAWIGYDEWRAETRLRLGEGMAGQAAQRREGLLSNDYPAEPYADARFLAHKPIRASMAEPLLYHERLIGVLTVDHDRPGAIFTNREQELLRLFASQAAFAIENARLFAVADRAAREARSLYEVTHSLTTSLNPMEILHLIAEKTTELLGTPHAQVSLWDEEGQVLRLGAAYGTETHQVERQVFRLGEGVNGIVAQTRTPLIVNDYQAFPHRVEGLTHVVADIAVPLVYLGRFLGVLNSHTTQAGAHFTQEHLGLLLSFADHAAIALEHASLYEQVKIHADELEQRIAERTRDLETANQQLEAASRHKSAFLANMSHELRTPLNSVLGFAQILLEQTPDLLSTKHTRFLTHIYTSGQHLLQLINDILDLSKVEAGKFVIQPEALPAAATVEDILVIARGLANKKGQRISATLAPDLPPLHADPVRFKQILFNLLSNAVKFTPAGGTITVTAHIADCGLRNAELPVTDPVPPSEIRNPKSAIGDFLEIAVTDTGIGIQPADIPRLFQEFVQLEAAAAKQHEGTGLGLALTKRLVEMHGGRIWATSEGEGRGSTFTVVLPFSGPPKAPEPSPAIQVS